ncbi:MAG: hypothetical protein ACRC1P_09470 [Cellulosilyticaceae bacterium]
MNRRNKKLIKYTGAGILSIAILGGVAYASWMTNRKDKVRINTGKLELTAKSKATQVLVDHNPSNPNQVEVANMLKGYVSVNNNLTQEGTSTAINGVAPGIDVVTTTQYVVNNKMPAKVVVEVIDNQGNVVPDDTVFIDYFGHAFDIWVGGTLGETNETYPIVDVDATTQRLYDNYEEMSQEQWYIDHINKPVEEWLFEYENVEQLTTPHGTVSQIKYSILRCLNKAGVLTDMETGIITPTETPIYINSYFGYTINESDVASNGGQNAEDFGFTVRLNLVQVSAIDVK